jgi:hypothetical protein
MFRKLFIPFIAAGLFAGLAYSAETAPDAVNRALRRAYPGARTEVIRSRDSNGVKIYEVNVSGREGQSTAEITESGDFLNWGTPMRESDRQIRNLQAQTEGLFKTQPTNVDLYRTTNYVVDFATAKETFQARFDALGRLIDLKSPRERERLVARDTHEKASGSEADRAREYAKEHFPDSEIQDVYRSSAGEHFYEVKTRDGNIVVNNNGEVFSMRQEISKDEVPAPVMRSIESLFARDNIRTVWRSQSDYYQFDETTSTGEKVTVKMRPNGDILRVVTPSAEEEAITARHREGARVRRPRD